ncbi:MAG: hypothetical protein ACD_5C00356G0003 [uncultured bacterium]|nr:MAG: hypothetical protein ACD_5C00356G0003 [uncultured bacterium]
MLSIASHQPHGNKLQVKSNQKIYKFEELYKPYKPYNFMNYFV